MFRATTAALILAAAAAATATAATAHAEGPAAYDIHESSMPQEDVTVIASYGGTTAWVDTDSGSVAVRQRGVARALEIALVDDLDVGPGPTGKPVAVYSRCSPSCDVFYLDLTNPKAKEMKVDVAARPGVSERLPTIWHDRIAFVRGDSTYVAPVDNGRATRIDGSGMDDLELGPGGTLTYAAQFSSDEGNGETGVVAMELDRRNRATQVDSQVIGEGSAAGFGGLTAQDGGVYYARLWRNGCRTPKRTTSRYDVKRRRAAKVTGSMVPLAVRAATFPIPATPMSEACEE